MDFGDLSDNPFAAELNPAPPRSGRKALLKAAKFFLMAAVCLSAIVVVGHQSQKWLLHRLTHDFDTLSVDAKRARLVEISDLGPLGINALVQTLTDKSPDVARTAYDLLRAHQNDWTVLSSGEIVKRHTILTESLAAVAIHLPDDRTGWGTSLLQQTIMESTQQGDEQSAELLDSATHAMELFALSDRPGPSILSEQSVVSHAPRRLTVTAAPLPVSSLGATEQWVDWPPPSDENASLAEPAGTLQGDPSASPIPAASRPSETISESPSLLRSSAARLAPVDPNEPVLLRSIHQPHETAFQATPTDAGEIQSVTHLVESPLDAFDDQSVMHWLGSDYEALREKARTELISRGYDPRQLSVATQIVTGDVQTRLALVDAISRSSALDPRPWMLMMLDDESVEVKLRVVSVLATMDDPSVRRKLQMHLVDERDLTVAMRIRRVLNLR